MSVNKIAHFELLSTNVSALKTFYGQAFGWKFKDYCDHYAAVEGVDLEGGFNGDAQSRSQAPLIMIESAGLEASLDQVQNAGGAITKPIFAYPGGRRFHFRDPAGNELAIFQPEE